MQLFGERALERRDRLGPPLVPTTSSAKIWPIAAWLAERVALICLDSMASSVRESNGELSKLRHQPDPSGLPHRCVERDLLSLRLGLHELPKLHWQPDGSHGGWL